MSSSREQQGEPIGSTTPIEDTAPVEGTMVLTEPAQVRAAFHPLRGTLLELLLERAASVQELAAAVQRPKSTVAHHVGVLHRAGLLVVVRTRTVRGRQERFYGRRARLFAVGDVRVDPAPGSPGFFETAALDARTAVQRDDLRGLTRYAWIDPSAAAEFWDRVLRLVEQYSRLTRTAEGTSAYALLTAMYPTDHPRLPSEGDR